MTVFAAALGVLALVNVCLALPAGAAERKEEATVVGKDRSAQAGEVPSDTRAVATESKMKKEEAPAGLKTDAPGVRTAEKMEKPKLPEPDRKKPEHRRGFGDTPIWIWILVAGILVAVAG
ncbi:MAG: hypothetical protein A3G34_02645 [Candidatus Lindowbacteria bacterium RIFCSPLOWO2_12_FULL_62_27]|nr:MAG: hypothetical protein A3I06_06395 [Candidatus Lindowbacteria bacterium RIFCSPLOWO2_02_FULL_62_12]OGH59199.1 MAG: hypothetical protein A3G34_02645 [Candidatus Lindowbacteria bacterium RIFCSPLOWO2_12_FULL_62_27]